MFPKSSDVLRTSYVLTKKYFWQIVKIGLIMIFFSFVVGFVVGLFSGDKSSTTPSAPTFLSFIVSVLSWFVQTYLQVGWVRFSLLLSRDIKPTLHTWSNIFPILFKYILASIVYSIVVVVGLILLIIPGIIWAIKYSYVLTLTVDKNLSLKDAFATSRDMTAGLKWRLMGFGGALLGVNILGFLLLGVGLIFTIPLTTIATYVMYNKLYERVGKPQAPETSSATSPPATLKA